LINGDRWRKSTYFFYASFIWYLRNNHACIGRETFKISSLSFCIECIEGKGWLSRSTHSCHNYKRVFWYLNRDIFKIMGSSISNNDLLWHRRGS
jgi:hypothetical protein